MGIPCEEKGQTFFRIERKTLVTDQHSDRIRAPCEASTAAGIEKEEE